MSEADGISLSRETLGGTAAQFTMAAIGFAGTVIFARWLGPATFGGVYLLFAVAKIADRPMNGWSLAAKKRLSESDSLRPPAFGAQLLFNVLWVALAVLAVVLAGDALRAYTGLALAPVLLVLLLATESTYETIESLVQGRGRISAATWNDTLRSILTLPLQLWFVALPGIAGAGMVYGLAVASALTLPIIALFVSARPAIPSRAFLRSLGDYARYSIPTSVLGTTYDRLDVLLLGFLLGSASAGFYEVAWKLTLPAVFVADIAGRGLMATVSARHARGEADSGNESGNRNGRGIGRDVSNTISYAGILAVPIFFGSLALSESLVVTVYGPDFRSAAPLLIGLAGYRVVRSQSGPLMQAINGLDRPDVAMRLSAVAVAVNLVLGVLLTLRLGPIGVVIATIVAETLVYLGGLHVLRQTVLGLAPISRPMVEQVGAGLAMFAVVSTARASVSVQSWVDLSVLVSVGGVVYVGLLLAVSPGVRHTLEEAVRESFPSL
ncbi:Membrane protein involved in the export of O-antigen and teichoic acid [Haladaptatus litoreus]|uniref:Membrane protein involved in the export of O-antigen and teichoic acid n=1 Tax=Haladaptatus litoreus TaxID=553468 RepID=A0A1N6V5R7_9EURY|nr:lipopolysaccharide biosynthesis protein [Haladaptatus litoreus]SIQ73157.1 Membrane protein involved in the export of O-antigen and teichoic acid [Haladaptatus litoreus]